MDCAVGKGKFSHLGRGIRNPIAFSKDHFSHPHLCFPPQNLDPIENCSFYMSEHNKAETKMGEGG